MSEASSLLRLVKEEIVENVITATVAQGKGKDKDGWCILVVDRPALRILSTCCRMTEVIEKGITLVEDIEKSRTPLIEFEAIYLCKPTVANAELIRKDFAAGQHPKYRAIHLFFLEACSDAVLARVADARLKRVIKTFKELSLGFIPLESRVYSLDRPHAFADAYNPKGSSENVNEIASQLASVCAVLGESPIIRYQSGRAANAKLALAVQQRVDTLRTYNAKMMASASSRKRSQLLILDRSVDLMSPLLHELTYQAAAYDLLEIEDDSFSLTYEDGQGRQQTRSVLLNEDDQLWVLQRHNHISKVNSEVNDEFKKFSAAHGGADTKKAGDVKQLAAMMKSMPQHRTEMAKFSTHLELATQINKVFTRKVELCTGVEQNLVTGEDDDGNKLKDYIGQISRVLVDRSIAIDNKLRCMMLLVLAMDGLKPDEMQRLFDTGSIPYTRRGAITNLEYLGAVVDAAAAGKQKKKKSKRPEREVEFKLSRWTPIVKDIMEDAIKNKLSVEEFPATKDSAGLGANADVEEDEEEAKSARQRGGWAKGKADRAKARDAEAAAKGGKKSGGGDKQRIIIYIVGTMSHSEMRSAYEVSKAFPDWDVYIGSGTVMRPTQFLDAVEHLDAPAEKDEPEPADGAIKVVKGRGKASKYAEEAV